jgi:hypothetical protein
LQTGWYFNRFSKKSQQKLATKASAFAEVSSFAEATAGRVGGQATPPYSLCRVLCVKHNVSSCILGFSERKTAFSVLKIRISVIGLPDLKQTKLEKQPTGCKLEYRFKAINSSGESMPSNTISVVL